MSSFESGDDPVGTPLEMPTAKDIAADDYLDLGSSDITCPADTVTTEETATASVAAEDLEVDSGLADNPELEDPGACDYGLIMSNSSPSDQQTNNGVPGNTALSVAVTNGGTASDRQGYSVASPLDCHIAAASGANTNSQITQPDLEQGGKEVSRDSDVGHRVGHIAVPTTDSDKQYTGSATGVDTAEIPTVSGDGDIQSPNFPTAHISEGHGEYPAPVPRDQEQSGHSQHHVGARTEGAAKVVRDADTSTASPENTDGRAAAFELDGWERQAAILQQATTELRAQCEKSDLYLADACGYSDAARELYSTTANIASPDRERIFQRISTDMAKYAARTGRADLAQWLFKSAIPRDQWDIYAEAYTAGHDHEQLAEWRVQLDTDYDQSPTTDRDPIVDASRLLALIKVSLHGLLPGDLPSRQTALNYGVELNEVVVSSNMRESFQSDATTAFAKAGVWEGVMENGPGYYQRHDPTKSKNIQFATKAVAGLLSKGERKMLLLGGITGKVLLWIDACQKGKQSEPPAIPQESRDYIQDLTLLEKIAPTLMIRLGFTPTSPEVGLRMALASQNFEAAKACYADILRPKAYSRCVSAALMMSQHLENVQSAGAAHTALESAFMSGLPQVESLVDAYTQGEPDAQLKETVMEEVDRMFQQLSELQDPVSSLPAKAHLLRLYLGISPDAPAVAELSRQIETHWTILEQRQGGDSELVAISRLLREAGIELVPQWKIAGYLGFVPLSPLRFNRTPDWTYTIRESRVPLMLNETANEVLTAAQLNACLGEERYIVRFEDPEDEKKAGELIKKFQAGQPSKSIEFARKPAILEGSWRSLYPALGVADYNEFSTAADMVRTGIPLHTKQELTRHLRQLIGQE